MISCCTASRANHLRSAGTMNHGASSVSVRSIAIRYASVYWSQYARSSRSPSLNFQCFVGSSRRASRRSACSSGAESIGYGAHLIREGLADGSVRIAVGTHALLGKGVTFADLGLLVIDERHRSPDGRRFAALEGIVDRLRRPAGAHQIVPAQPSQML